MNSSESSGAINNSPNGVKEQVTIATNHVEAITIDTSTQTTSSSTTTTKRTTLPAVVFIPKPTTSTTTTATPSSSDTPTPSFNISGLIEFNDGTTNNTKFQYNSSSIVPDHINDDDNAITKTKNVWDEEQTENSSEFLESEEEGSGSGSGPGASEFSTPEYLEDLYNYKRIYPRFKNPIDEEYLKKIAHD